MIALTSVLFKYAEGDFCLDVPELNVAAGETLAVVGPSGCGKTTLLNLVAGIFQPDAGSIKVVDSEVQKQSDAVRRAFRLQNLGFVFQDFALIEYLNVFDNIVHPYRVSSALVLSAEVRKRANDLAKEMGIANKLKRFPRELSRGEQQRVAISRALISEPKIILADEATGNLDPENKQKILALLFKAAKERKAALLAVTHDHELLPLFDRVVDFRDLKRKEAV